MADLRSVMIVSYTPVQDDAGLSGKVIGHIFGNYVPFQCVVDYSKLHDGMVTIADPPTWRNTGKVGWVEWSHCVEGGGQDDEVVQLLVTYYLDGRQPSVKVIG